MSCVGAAEQIRDEHKPIALRPEHAASSVLFLGNLPIAFFLEKIGWCKVAAVERESVMGLSLEY